jgi:hypothetical protein
MVNNKQGLGACSCNISLVEMRAGYAIFNFESEPKQLEEFQEVNDG